MRIVLVFQIEKAMPSGDGYPPGRVVDLSILAMDADKMTVSIQWTAPGDELDSGTGFLLSSS